MSTETPRQRRMKEWNKLKGDNAWMMFKVVSEFVDGFEKLNHIPPCISIFGSARTKEDNPYYQLAREIGRRATEEGYGVITGGGPGIMEAGNRGAKENNGVSVGLNIYLPFEQSGNKWVDYDKNVEHKFFFVRKVMFVKYAQAFVVMPGGFGTLDECFEVLTLIQTEKIDKVPVILVGKDYWGGLVDWIKSTMLGKERNINAGDLDLFHLTDDPSEVIRIINDFYAPDAGGVLEPNFNF